VTVSTKLLQKLSGLLFWPTLVVSTVGLSAKKAFEVRGR